MEITIAELSRERDKVFAERLHRDKEILALKQQRD